MTVQDLEQTPERGSRTAYETPKKILASEKYLEDKFSPQRESHLTPLTAQEQFGYQSHHLDSYLGRNPSSSSMKTVTFELSSDVRNASKMQTDNIY